MRVLSILMALGVALGVFLWLALGQAPERTSAIAVPETSAAKAIEVRAMRSRAQALERRLELRGVAEAARRVEVRAQTEGRVISTPKRKGARVAKGELLCRIEPGGRPAELASVKARLAQAEADARASGTLARRGFSAEVKVAADTAALEAARSAVAAMELDLARTAIGAPFTGRLEGDAAETGVLLQSGDVCATLIDLDPIRLVGFAPETEIFALKPGLAVEARLLDGTAIAAKLTFVARSADLDTRTYRVEATAQNAAEKVRDGATVLMRISKAPASAHRLPHSALTLNDAGRLGVRLVERGQDADGEPVERARFAAVEVLRDDKDGVWLSGLPERANVILIGQEFVGDGSLIRARYKDDAAAQAADSQGSAE